MIYDPFKTSAENLEDAKDVKEKAKFERDTKAKNRNVVRYHKEREAKQAEIKAKKDAERAEREAANAVKQNEAEGKNASSQAKASSALAKAELAKAKYATVKSAAETVAFTEKVESITPFAIGGALLVAGLVGAIFFWRK